MNAIVVLLLGVVIGMLAVVVFRWLYAYECAGCRKKGKAKNIWSMLDEGNEDEDNGTGRAGHSASHIFMKAPSSRPSTGDDVEDEDVDLEGYLVS